MTSTDRTPPLLAQLETALDAHGARPERWPEASRAALTALIAADAGAAKLFAEAQALDALLDASPAYAPPGGLEARILAAASDPAPMHRSQPMFGNIDAGERAGAGERRSRSAARKQRPFLIPAARAARGMWLEAALLAASLFIGFAIGLSGEVLPALQDVALIGGFLDPDGEAL